MNRGLVTRCLCILLMSSCLVGGCRKKAAEAPAGGDDAKPTAVVALAPATRHDMAETVEAQGTLAPVQGGSGRISVPYAARVLRVLVREGDRVSAGQVVAVLDTRSQQAQAQSASAALRTAQAQARQSDLSAQATASDQVSALRTARLGLAAAISDRAGSVQSAKTALDLAQSDLKRVRAGARPQEIAQAQAALNQAQATQSRANAEADRQQFLFNKGVSARRQLEDAQTALAVANGAVDTARSSLDLLRTGARPEERAAAELRVRQALETLRQAQISGDSRIAQARAVLRQAEQGRLQVAAKAQEVVAARSNAGKAQADLASAATVANYGILRAPLAGVVTRRNTNPGDMADPATPILEIAESRALELTAGLPEEDGSRVRVGMNASVTLVDNPEARPVLARVQSVGQVDPQTNLLSVRLLVPNSGGALRVGAFAVAKITVRVARQAVVVPKQVVISRENKSVVYVASGTGDEMTAKQREITTGVEQSTLVEVRQGLKAGEQVVSEGQYELSDGQKIKLAGADDKKDEKKDEKAGGKADDKAADKGGDKGGKSTDDKGGASDTSSKGTK